MIAISLYPESCKNSCLYIRRFHAVSKRTLQVKILRVLKQLTKGSVFCYLSHTHVTNTSHQSTIFSRAPQTYFADSHASHSLTTRATSNAPNQPACYGWDHSKAQLDLVAFVRTNPVPTEVSMKTENLPYHS